MPSLQQITTFMKSAILIIIAVMYDIPDKNIVSFSLWSPNGTRVSPYTFSIMVYTV